jgi:hypothetical protein
MKQNVGPEGNVLLGNGIGDQPLGQVRTFREARSTSPRHSG